MCVITPVVMAGGSGTRLWPLSRSLYPKQFLKLGYTETLLQQVFRRLEGLAISNPLVICNEEHRFLVAEQLREMGELNHNILLEPQGKNTAPAVALAAFAALRSDAEAVLLVLASDHVIQDTQAFQNAVKRSLPLAQRGELVTFGIVPSHPETGYGYIKQGSPVDGGAL